MGVEPKNREEIVRLLNNMGVSGGISAVGLVALQRVAEQINGVRDSKFEYTPEMLLDSLGPATSAAAIDFCLSHLRRQGKIPEAIAGRLTANDLAQNYHLVRNDAACWADFQSSVREYLIPRYSYYDVDAMLDHRHKVNRECGYPHYVTPIMYRLMYDRDDMTNRACNVLPDECFAVDPEVYEDEDETVDTDLESDYKRLCDEFNLIGILHRADRLAGLGHYTPVLMGLDDTDDLEQPVNEPDLNKGLRRTVASKRRELLYLRPFDEYMSYVAQFDLDQTSPRYGMPVLYNLVFQDLSIDQPGASIGTRIMKRVHWTRVIHNNDLIDAGTCFHTPRLQPIFNRLLDRRRIMGADPQAMWMGGFPGLNFKIDPRIVGDRPDYDEDKMRQEVNDFMDGLTRAIKTIGMEVSALQVSIADPTPHVHVQNQAIATFLGTPLRVLMGTEESRQASSQDKLTFNTRLGQRIRRVLTPNLVRNAMDRFIAVGVVSPPRDSKAWYKIGWGDLNTVTDEDKANLALKWTQALSQYVAAGIIHLIDVVDYLVLIVGLRPSEAVRISEYCKKEGLQKLKDVDPSKGAGQNGVAQNISKGADGNSNSGRPAQRDTADRKADGMKG